MKSQSNIMQDRIWIRYIDEEGYCIFRLRDNFQELQREGFDEQTEIYYEYDEVELKLLNRENIEQFIEDNFNDLFQFGLEQEIKQKEEQEREHRIHELIKQGAIIDEFKKLEDENKKLKALKDYVNGLNEDFANFIEFYESTLQ